MTTRSSSSTKGPIETDAIDLYVTAGPTRKRQRLSGKSQVNMAMNRTQALSKRSEVIDGSEPDELDGAADSHGEAGSAKSQNVKPMTTRVVLKGRKRFSADFAEVEEQSKNGFEVGGLIVQSFRAGDDEGSMEFKILRGQQHIASVSLLVSDTSEYPDHHTYFAFSPDQDLVPPVQRIIENVSSGPSLPIREAIEKLLSALSRAIDSETQRQAAPDIREVIQIHSDSEQDDDEDEDYDPYADDDTFGGIGISGDPALATTKNIVQLKRDFIETVAAGYRPGHVSFGMDDFVISISIPVISLASFIPPRALMAWDRRLLSRNQHLTLLISGLHGIYPPLQADGSYTQTAVWRGVSLQFKVGLTRNYKPSKNEAAETCRAFGMIVPDAEDELRKEAELFQDYDLAADAMEARSIFSEDYDNGDESHFDKFSLSSSLESLLDQALLRLIQLRRKFRLGWAGAEMLLAEVEKSQKHPDDILAAKKQEIKAADLMEVEFGNNLALDPLNGADIEDINLPLTAFCYLLRRVTLCNLYCLVCHNLIRKDFIALKPYVCDSKLCAYQYYSLNRGSSLEYEILSNPEVVDLLVSLTYVAAAEGVLDEPLPVGMALRVEVPNPDTLVNQNPAPTVNAYGLPIPTPTLTYSENTREVKADAEGMCDFDDLDIRQMRAVIVALIDSLPSIDDMKRHLERRVKSGKLKPRLKDLDPTISPAAWSILRWCVASCTAYLEETSEEERIPSIGTGWKQFRFSVGTPDAEAKFNTAVATAGHNNSNAMKYPTLYAFHGSPLRNWHSIIRHGLWYKSVTHGRAYGDGVYLAKDGSVSMGYYAAPSTSLWRNSKNRPATCVALAEIVNLPHQFQSCNPYYVIKDTHWIMCRYLLVSGRTGETSANEQEHSCIPFVKHDPAHPVVLSGKKLNIPDPSYYLEKLLAARQSEYMDEDPDEEDLAIFEAADLPSQSQFQPKVPGSASTKKIKDDWEHNAKWVRDSTDHLMPPPLDSTPASTMAVQRELRAMLKEQESAHNLADLGWYLPPDFMGDNLFQWIVELHSFDKELPITKDMKAKNVNSIIFEIRFPPAFPIAPPFFRIIRPRFLPFIQGGGGHVTGGGSICMDLLTADGWLPSYSISAIFLQIKLAISNLDPRPARLAGNWDTPYGTHEALEGYKRAASAHGWKIPQGLDRLVR